MAIKLQGIGALVEMVMQIGIDYGFEPELTVYADHDDGADEEYGGHDILIDVGDGRLHIFIHGEYDGNVRIHHLTKDREWVSSCTTKLKWLPDPQFVNAVLSVFDTRIKEAEDDRKYGKLQ